MITEDYLDELAEDCVESYDDIVVYTDKDADTYNMRGVFYEDAVEIYKDGFREALRRLNEEITKDYAIDKAAWEYANREYELYPFITEVANAFEDGAAWALQQIEKEKEKE